MNLIVTVLCGLCFTVALGLCLVALGKPYEDALTCLLIAPLWIGAGAAVIVMAVAVQFAVRRK